MKYRANKSDMFDFIKSVAPELRDLVITLNKVSGIAAYDVVGTGLDDKPVRIYLKFRSIEELNHFLWLGGGSYFAVATSGVGDSATKWQLSIDNNSEVTYLDDFISLCLWSVSKGAEFLDDCRKLSEGMIKSFYSADELNILESEEQWERNFWRYYERDAKCVSLVK